MIISQILIKLNENSSSPSPEPVYSSDGKRLNTRDVRTRRKLEDMRHSLITEMKVINPHYMPPADYKVHFHNKSELRNC